MPDRRPSGASPHSRKTPARETTQTSDESPRGKDRDEKFRLRLYVAGQTPKSIRAFANLQKICEKHMPGKYEIEVLDLIDKPHLARGDQIFAVPTLVKKLPLPVRKIIGDLSDEKRVLVGLDIEEI